MHVNKTKFERNGSLEYYHMTCIGKQNIPAKEDCCCDPDVCYHGNETSPFSSLSRSQITPQLPVTVAHNWTYSGSKGLVPLYADVSAYSTDMLYRGHLLLSSSWPRH